jgi:T5SS/PEP-CTERM-associated repeat protein
MLARLLRFAPATAILVAAQGALAARVDSGQVSNLPQAPWSSLLVIGVAGEGSVTIDGGTQVEEDSVALGGLAPGSGSLEVSGAGSRLTCVGDATTRASLLVVGAAGAGSVAIRDGGTVDVDGTANQAGDLGAAVALAIEAGSIGNALVSGAGSQLRVRNGAADAAGLAVALGGSAALRVEAGASLAVDTGTGANSGVTVANDAGSLGELTVTGPGSTLEVTGAATGLTVGNAGDGTLILEDGAGASAQVGFVGLASGSTGRVELRSGALLQLSGANPLLGFGGSLDVGMAGTGSLLIEDASLVLDHDQPHGVEIGGTTGCGGPCPFTGGTGSAIVRGADGELRVSGTGGFVLIGGDGDGSLTLGDGAAVAADQVTVGPGGRLAGDGTVSANLLNEGAIGPGGSVGSLVVEGDLRQTSGALDLEIAGTGPGEADRIDVQGSFELAGGALNLDFVGGFLPQAGDEVVLGSGAPLSLDSPAASVRAPSPGLAFELVAEGNQLVFRALSDATGFGACQASELKAFAKLCKKRFACEAGFVKRAAKDTGGTKRDACVAKAGAGFARSYDKALARASRKGESCGLGVPAEEAGDAVALPAEALVAEVLEGWTPGADRDDDALRAALLGRAGSLCASLLSIEGKQVRKRDLAREGAARAGSLQKFESRAGKALAKAAGRGVVYAGPDAPAIAAATDALATDATSTTAGVWP